MEGPGHQGKPSVLKYLQGRDPRRKDQKGQRLEAGRLSRRLAVALPKPESLTQQHRQYPEAATLQEGSEQTLPSLAW